MTKQPSNKHLILMLCMCLPVVLQAQHFRYQCLTDTVKETGFYSIAITPEMSAHMQTDFRDVRIWDEKKQQVPYIIISHRPKWKNRVFLPFPIIESKLDDSSNSIITIQKNVGYSIPDLALIIKYASVSRYADLSGSNDGKKWFTISEHLLINESPETLEDSSVQTILFATSNYQYFKLKIYNHKGDPLNIKSIGHYQPYPQVDYSSLKLYVDNPKLSFIQTDSSNGISYIKVLQQQSFRVNQIRFEVEAPMFFSRVISVSIPETVSSKQQHYLKELTSFTLSSGSALQTEVPVFKNNEFYLSVHNGDNPPFKVKSVITAQENQSLEMWLEAGKQYTIVMDAEDASAPKYDLQLFEDKIPSSIMHLSIGKIEPVAITSATNAPDKKNPFPQKWLWLIMAGAVSILALLTWRLTGEMRKKEP